MAQNPEYDEAAFKQFEHDGWAEVSGTYHDTFALCTQQAIEPMLDVAGAAEGTRLLDVACGTGNLTAFAAKRGAEPMGLDYVESMVSEARSLHPGLEFRQGDAEALPFEDGAFESVTCNFGILHFPNPEQAIAEAFRVLAPGSRCAFSSWSPPDQSPFMALLLGAVEEHGDMNVPIPPGPPIFRFSNPAECEKVLAATGFSNVSCQDLPIVARFDSPEGVMETLNRGMVRIKAIIKMQTPENQARIEAAITEGAKEFETGGTIEIPQPALLAVGYKP